MEWFKHKASARNDFKLRDLHRRFGMEGIGVYWSIIELLASESDRSFRVSLEVHSIFDIADDFKVEEGRLKSMFEFMAKVGLIDADDYNANMLSCKALVNRADDYTKRVMRNKKKVRSRSGQSTVNNPLEEKRREENRREKEEMLTHWNSTPLPKIVSWSKERAIKLAERMRSEHFRNNWKEAVTRLSQSSFALGESKTGWKADIGWFLNNDTNYIKVLEGKYDGKSADIFNKY